MANPYPTYDYETEQSDIARRQKVADAMLGGALSPIDLPQQTGPVASRVSPLAIIAKMAQAKVAGDSSEALKKEKAALGERYKTDLSSGVEEYLRNLEGYEAPSAPMEGAPMEKVAGDPRKAAINALASNHPVLQALGMEQMKKLTTAQKRKVKEVGGMLYDEDTLETVALGGAKPTQKVMGGDLYEQNPSTGQWKKLDNAPKISVSNTNTSVNKGETEFMKGVGKQNADAVAGAQARKQAGQRMLVLSDNLDKLEKSGVLSGPTANIAMSVGSFADSVGLSVDKQKLASSEAYQAQIAKEVAAVITSKEAGVGRSMSEGDRVMFEKQFPQLILSSGGRKQIVEKLRQTGIEDIKYADGVTKKVKEIYPEAANLMDIAPSTSPYPLDAPAPKIRTYNPATRRLE